jgi:hypothetical protein
MVMTAATATRGRRPRNTARHDAACSTTTAREGPTTPGITHAVDMTAKTRGRNAGG